MGVFRFFRRAQWDDERANELEDYLARELDDNIARGMTPDVAGHAARRKLGNPTRIREEIYEMNTMPLFDALWQDLRYGIRLLRRNPTFALVAVLTLALGTGANAAIFQLVNALRLRSLPVERPHELVSIRIDQHGTGRVGRGLAGGVFTEPLWQEIRSQQQAFSSAFAWGADRWDLSTAGEVALARGFYVSGRFFDVLGVHAQAGRVLMEADDQKGCGSPGAVLSHDFWQTRYAANPQAIGQRIMLDRLAFDIIGVAQPGFFGVEVGRTFDVALPLCAEPLFRGQQAATGQRAVWWLDIMGRLKPDWTVERAQAHLAAVSPAVFQATVSPTYKAEWTKHYTSFTLTARRAPNGVSNLRTAYATQLWALLGATGLVVLLTCVNLANLMLARSSARGHEIAVRLAIGASRGRVVRQMLSESALLAGLGALGGLLLARWLSHMLVRFLNGGTTRISMDLAPDWRVFLFIALSAVLTCVLFGLSPALQATRRDLATTMRPGSRSSIDGHETVTLRRELVVVQVAVSMVLVVGALLFGRTLRNLASVELGFNPNIVVASVDLRRTAVPSEARPHTFADIVTRLHMVPGVRHAAETAIVPLSGGDWNGQIVKGGVVQDGDVHFNAVDGNYFRVMETPILAGRTFDNGDQPGAQRAAIVNETFARRYFQHTDPIGQTFEVDVPRTPKPAYHIVGLVRDAKFLQVREERTVAAVRFSANESSAMFLPIAYLAVAQEMPALPDMRIVVRSDLRPAAVTPALTRAITEIAPGAAVSYDSVASYIDTLLVPERLMAWLSGFFGVLAMLIGAIGLYGVMSYIVTRRRIEIGVRMALGADRGAVIRMVLAESGTLLGVGVAIGVALAMLASRYAASLLYGLTPFDPTSFALGIIALGCVGLAAAWLPAWRASRLAPAVALRE
jgi:putative ABC transport system permease protein